MVAEHVTVSGRHMELGESLTEHVQQQMGNLSAKYFGRMVTCRVVFARRSKGRNFTCNIQVLVGRDLHYRSNAEFDNVHGCFNHASERMAKQLRRKKRALHEDKPTHQKAQVLNDLSKPDPVEANILPIDGNDLSIADVTADDAARVVQQMYAKKFD
jgi:ribosomal subunit interface protein